MGAPQPLRTIANHDQPLQARIAEQQRSPRHALGHIEDALEIARYGKLASDAWTEAVERAIAGVEKMGGAIKVTSTVGRGSTFEVRVPLVS